jgi:hypothetical protein
MKPVAGRALALLLTLGVLVALALPAGASSSVLFPFPSSGSTVVRDEASDIPADRYGLFHSADDGHGVWETFAPGCGHVDRAILRLKVASNGMELDDEFVDWKFAINGTQVGSFTVAMGVTLITLDETFAPIAGPLYEVSVEVTNSSDTGSHGLAYAGDPLVSWVELFCSDEAPRVAACADGVNPHGNAANGNGNGFYQLTGTPDDGSAWILVLDTGHDGIAGTDDDTTFGPYESGTGIKYTEAASTPKAKKMGSGNGHAGAVAWHITGNGPAAVYPQGANASAAVMCQ